MCAGLFPQQFPWVARLPAPLLSFRPSGPGFRLGQLVCPTYACLDESRAHASCIFGPARGRRIRRLFPRQVHFLPPGASARLAGKLPRRPTSLFPSDYNITACRKSGLRHFFEVFIAPLRLRRGQGAMQGNPCYARLFADLTRTPQGAFSCPFGTIHLVSPNPIIASVGAKPSAASGGRSEAEAQ